MIAEEEKQCPKPALRSRDSTTKLIHVHASRSSVWFLYPVFNQAVSLPNLISSLNESKSHLRIRKTLMKARKPGIPYLTLTQAIKDDYWLNYPLAISYECVDRIKERKATQEY